MTPKFDPPQVFQMRRLRVVSPLYYEDSFVVVLMADYRSQFLKVFDSSLPTRVLADSRVSYDRLGHIRFFQILHLLLSQLHISKSARLVHP